MHGSYPTIHVYQNVPFSLMAFMLSRLFSTPFGSVADPDPNPDPPDPHVFGPPGSGSTGSVADPDPNPDPPDPHVFGPPGSGSGSTSQRYGSGSFYHHAKTVRKTLIPTIL